MSLASPPPLWSLLSQGAPSAALPRGARNTLAALGLLYPLVLLALSLLRPDWVLPMIALPIGVGVMLLGTAVTLPLYLLTTFGGEILLPGLPVSLNRLAAVFFLASALIELYLRGWHGRITAPMVAFAAFHAYFLSMAVVKRPEGAALYYQPVLYFFLLLVLAGRFHERMRRRRLLQFTLGIAFAMGLVGLAEFALGLDFRTLPRYVTAWNGTPRINGMAKDSIQFGFINSYFALMGLYLLTTTVSKHLRLVYSGIVLVLAVASVLTLNRQTPFILGGMVAVFIALCRWEHRRLLAGGVLATALLLAPVVGVKLLERFQRAQSVRLDASLAQRHDNLTIAIEMVKANPLTGIGHNYYDHFWKQYRPVGETFAIQDTWQERFYIDLGYVQMITEYGLAGVSLWLLFVASLAWTWFRAYRTAKALDDRESINLLAALAALVAQVAVTMLMQDTFGTIRTYLLIGVLLGVAETVRRLAREPLEAGRSSP
ncbi:MAG: O-antigen ligase family protein [Candidatus Sumerlaeia bacterium]|nr:O-antigen ligase family protein [Candidatus Sumerlaeia bacterium]